MENDQNNLQPIQVPIYHEDGSVSVTEWINETDPGRITDMDEAIAAELERRLNTSDTPFDRFRGIRRQDIEAFVPTDWPQPTRPQETLPQLSLPSEAPDGRSEWDLPDFYSLYPDLVEFNQTNDLQGNDHIYHNIDQRGITPQASLPPQPETVEVSSLPSLPSASTSSSSSTPAVLSTEDMTPTFVSQSSSQQSESSAAPSPSHSERSLDPEVASSYESDDIIASSEEEVKPKRRILKRTVKPESTNMTKRIHNADGTPRKSQIPKDYSSAIELPAGGETSRGVHKKAGEKCLTCIKYERGCKGTLVKNSKCETCGGKSSQKRACLWADKANGVSTYEQAQDFTKSRRIQQNTSRGVAARKKARTSPKLKEETESSSDEAETSATSPSHQHYLAVEAPGPTDESAEGTERARTVIMNTAFLEALQIFRDEVDANNERAAVSTLAAIHVARGNQQRVVDLLRSTEGQHQAFVDERQHLRDQLPHGTVPVVQRQYETDERTAIMENALELPTELLNQVYAILRTAGLVPFDGFDVSLIPDWAISAIDYILRNL